MLELKARTFLQSKNGMFYYKKNENINININIKSDNLKMINNTFLIRDENSFFRIINNLNNIPINNNFDIILKFRKSFKNYNIYEIINPIKRVNEIHKNENYINDLNEAMWYPVCSNIRENEEIYIVNENDIIKLGRVKLEIIKKHINKINKTNTKKNNCQYNISNINLNSKPIFNIDISTGNYKVKEKNTNVDQEVNEKVNVNRINKEEKENDARQTISYNSQKLTNSTSIVNKVESKNSSYSNDLETEICFICLKNESTIENPLVTLCKCKNFVHFQCLRNLLNLKIIIKRNEKGTVIEYYCPKFNCDVCLSPYPLQFRIPKFNMVYELIDLKMLPEDSNYLVIESLDYIKEKKNIKIVYFILLLDDDKIKIGRHTSNDIIHDDVSISRFHCELKFDKDNGNVILENKSEKFGTLVLIRNNIKMNENEIKFQVGRTLISAKLTTRGSGDDETTEYNFE